MGDEKVPQKRSLTVETFICEKYSSTFQQLGLETSPEKSRKLKCFFSLLVSDHDCFGQLGFDTIQLST